MKRSIIIWIIIILVFNATFVDSNVESYQFMDYSQFAQVDLSGGDMSLSIPLFNVPGRNGLDFSVALSYHAGITTNQPASWVGLGWALGVPSVTRMVNGVPDEYKGGSVNINYKPQRVPWYEKVFNIIGNNFFISTNPNAMAQHYVTTAGTYLEASLSGDLGVEVDFSGLALKEGNNQREIDGFFNIINEEDVEQFFPSEEQYYCTEADTSCPTDYSCVLKEISCDGDADCLTPAHESYNYDGSGYQHRIYDKCWNNEFCIQEHVYDATECYGCYSSSKLYKCEKPWGVDKEQPDSYFISMAAASGKLVVDKTHNPSLTTRWKLQKATNDLQNDVTPIFQGDSLTGFIFKGLHGTRYYFTHQEIVKSSTSRRAMSWNSNCKSSDDYMEFNLNDAHPYMWKLEKILSHDYEDTDNTPGPSDGDKGNWIKFDYVEYANNFLVKQPYDDSCDITSNGFSAKSSQTMTVSYLSSIETPTHKAVFTVDFNRDDGKESGSGTRNHPKLAEVSLYSKQGTSEIKITSYSFDYDYSLVQGAPESSSGRLTLKSVTQHNADKTQSLPSYQFEYSYGDQSSQPSFSYDQEGFPIINNLNHNPVWEKNKHDRWGYYAYYKSDKDFTESGHDTALFGKLVGDAWSLTKVTWPNGGATEWTYENDRYTKIGNTDTDYFLGWKDAWHNDIEPQDSHYGGGIRVNFVRNCNGMGECVAEKYLYTKEGFELDENDGIYQHQVYGESSGVATLEPGHYLQKYDDRIVRGSIHTSGYVGYGRVARIPFFDEEENKAQYGYEVYNFNTATDQQNYGEIFFDPNNLDWCKKNGDYGICQNPVGDCLNIFLAPPRTELELRSGGSYVNDICTTNDKGYCQGVISLNTRYKEISDGNYIVQKKDTASTGFQITFLRGFMGCCAERGSKGDRDDNGVCDVLELPESVLNHGEKSREHKRGLLKKIEYYDNNKNLVKTTENTYDLANVLDWDDFLKSGTRYLTKQRQIVDGLTTDVAYEYNVNGLPSEVSVKNSDGSERITKTFYAYNKYPEMAEKHMLGQVYQSKTYKDLALSENLISMSRTSWNKFNDKWRPSSTQAWKDSNDDNTLQDDELITIQTFESYDDYGSLLVSRDAKRNPTYRYYGNNNQCSNSGNNLKHSTPTCMENSLGHQIKNSYNRRYFLETLTSPNNKLTRHGYDSFNRLEKIAYPGSSLTNPDVTYEYHFFENINNPNWVMTTTKIDDSKEVVSKSFFDGLGRNIQSQIRQDDNNWIISKRESYDKTNLLDKVYKPVIKNTNGNFDSSNPLGIYSKTIYYQDPLFRIKEVFPAVESDG